MAAMWAPRRDRGTAQKGGSAATPVPAPKLCVSVFRRLAAAQEPATLEDVFDRPATAWPKSTLPWLSPEQSNTRKTQMRNIFVGNLDFSATESSIRSLFEQHGTVDRVNLVTDRDTGRSRGFAFVRSEER